MHKWALFKCLALNYVVWGSKHGFEIIGIVGINSSPCCGVDTTSDYDAEISGQGAFVNHSTKNKGNLSGASSWSDVNKIA